MSYDYEKSEFYFVSIKGEQPISVPQHVMNCKGLKIAELNDCACRFLWISESEFKYVTKEGLERIFEFNTSGEFTEKAYNIVPYFSEEKYLHFYLAKSPLKETNVKKRLIRKYQDYKSNYFLHQKISMDEMLPKLITIDYGYHQDKYSSPICISFPFTYLDWKLITKIGAKQMKLASIETSNDVIALNILPSGETLLHKING